MIAASRIRAASGTFQRTSQRVYE